MCLYLFYVSILSKLYDCCYLHENNSECAPTICVDVTSVYVDYRPPSSSLSDTLADKLSSSKALPPLIMPLLPNASVADSSYLPSLTTLSAFTALPTCSLCMRRLRFVTAELLHTSSVSSPCHLSMVDGKKEYYSTEVEDIVTGDIAVGRTFYCNAYVASHSDWFAISDHECASQKAMEDSTSKKDVRCFVCAMYDLVQKKEYYKSNRSLLDSFTKGISHHVGKCVGCGLSENIWICMQCGYAGCGRYTSKHAHSHYLATTAAAAEASKDFSKTSFEFAHPYSMELATGRIWDYSLDRFLNYEQVSSLYSGMLPTDSYAMHHNLSFERYDATVIGNTTEDELNTSRDHPTPSTPATKMLVSYEEMVSPLASTGMAATTSASMAADIQQNIGTTKMEHAYEQMLEMELQEQTLHYEKLLARETVKAMEWAFRKNHHPHHNTSNENKKKSNTNSSSSSSTAGTNQNTATSVSIEEGLEEIEAMKLEISAIEAEYQALKQQVRFGEEEIRRQKAVNDAIVRDHKALVSLNFIPTKYLLWIVFN